jgi:hypothetical protein
MNNCKRKKTKWSSLLYFTKLNHMNVKQHGLVINQFVIILLQLNASLLTRYAFTSLPPTVCKLQCRRNQLRSCVFLVTRPVWLGSSEIRVAHLSHQHWRGHWYTWLAISINVKSKTKAKINYEGENVKWFKVVGGSRLQT